ncbi:MAG: hypothetical protein AVDCRST_MAG41-4064, partial [uncultured Corynebacteriales bacterium]
GPRDRPATRGRVGRAAAPGGRPAPAGHRPDPPPAGPAGRPPDRFVPAPLRGDPGRRA